MIRSKIASRYPEVTLIQHPVNKGLAAARNTALRAARNEMVASVDADVVADPELDSHAPSASGTIRKWRVPAASLVEGVQTTLADRWRRARMAQEWGHPVHPQSEVPIWLQQRVPEIRDLGSRGVQRIVARLW